MYVCMCVYICLFVCVYVCMYVCACVRVCQPTLLGVFIEYNRSGASPGVMTPTQTPSPAGTWLRPFNLLCVALLVYMLDVYEWGLAMGRSRQGTPIRPSLRRAYPAGALRHYPRAITLPVS